MSKPRNFFAYKKDIVALRKKIKELNKQKKEIQSRIKKLSDMFSFPPEYKGQIPAVSDLYASKDRKDSQIDMLSLRNKIKREHQESVDELEKIMSEIRDQEFSLVLAKINYVEQEISPEKDEKS